MSNYLLQPNTWPAMALEVAGAPGVLHEVPLAGGIVEDVVTRGPLDMRVCNGHHLRAGQMPHQHS